MRAVLPTFIEPSVPKRANSPPKGPEWLHEPKLDGWRVQVHVDGDTVSVLSRRGRSIVERLPETKKALSSLRLRSCVIDGELVGSGDVFTLHRALGDRREDQITIAAFDLLVLNGIDLRTLPLAGRKEGLRKLVDKAPACLQRVEDFPDGAQLLEAVDRLGIEGIVSKRRDQSYRSGARGGWLKIKCEAWLKANKNRWEIFAR
jgi:bifunctional non-homologous end joining protein LigD